MVRNVITIQMEGIEKEEDVGVRTAAVNLLVHIALTQKSEVVPDILTLLENVSLHFDHQSISLVMEAARMLPLYSLETIQRRCFPNPSLCPFLLPITNYRDEFFYVLPWIKSYSIITHFYRTSPTLHFLQDYMSQEVHSGTN